VEKGTTAVKLEGCPLLSNYPVYGIFQGGYQQSGMVLPVVNYFTIVTPALQKNITLFMGRANLFSREAKESIKNNTSRGDEVVQLSPTYYPYTRGVLINCKSLKSVLNLYSLYT